MDNWLNHVNSPATHSNGSGSIIRNGTSRTGNSEYPWSKCEIDLRDEKIITQVQERSHDVSDPLLHVDTSVDGLNMWRIKDGALEHWRKEDYGQFYDKECFLALHVRHYGLHGEEPTRTLHLWVGKWSSEMSYRLAVHKTIEMNITLGNAAIIHREPQGKETVSFKAHFPFITYMKGTADDSYWHTVRTRGMHQSRLLKCYRPDPRFDHYRIAEVPARSNQLNNSFVYILDRGDQIYQWNGELCKTEDVFKASKYVQKLRASRGMNVKVDTLNDEGDDEGRHPFYMFLSRRSYMGDGEEEDEQRTLAFPTSRRATGTTARGLLFRISSHSNGAQFKKIKDGIITMKEVSKEVSCIIDLVDICILWFSQRAEPRDRVQGLAIIHEYLRHSRQPLTPAVVISQGQRSSELTRALDN